MKLDAIETRSAVWLKVQAHLQARLELMRMRNDGALPHEETCTLRGRIAQVKEILALGQPEPDEGVVTHDATTDVGDAFGIGS